MEALELPSCCHSADAYGVSADGTVVAGHAFFYSAAIHQAFSWTEGSGLTELFTNTVAAARGVSGDGSVVVGNAEGAFRWTAAGGLVHLSDQGNGNTFNRARDVSADGSVLVGIGNLNGEFDAVRWTAAGGMVGLGSLPGSINADSFEEAFSVSADGSTIVGRTGTSSTSGAGFLEAFRWTESGGMVGLGDLQGYGLNSFAIGVSGDGSVIVGSSEAYFCAPGCVNGDPEYEAFYWTEGGGMMRLVDLLIALGVDALDGWTLATARGVSYDGNIIVGDGINPFGDTEAWMVNLTTVPVPGAVWLFGSALVLLGWMRRKSE
jgi:uncharacterized membrane protein